MISYEEATYGETPIGSPVSVIICTFISSAGGAVSEETKKVLGSVKRVVTNPDNIDTPDVGWDLTIEDEDGVDVLCGNGADRDAGGVGASEQAFPCPGNIAVASKLTFKIANAGGTKKGVVKIYIV